MTGKLDLSDVTLCIADCVNPVLAARSLSRSMRLCTFADAILFTSLPATGAFRTVQIEPLASRANGRRLPLDRIRANDRSRRLRTHGSQG
jgi:hypothetical protein